MARAAGSSTERGYGSSHQKRRAAAMAMYRPGQPCTECGQPLTGLATDHDLAHDHVNGGYKGLAHRSCNRAEGASRGNRGSPRLIISATDRSPVCSACGAKYHYAAKRCEVCGVHYHPSGGTVRTCSRACGVQLRRRVYGWAGSKAPQPRPACRMCGKPCAGPQNTYCGTACANQARSRTWPASKIQYYTCRYCGKTEVARDRRSQVCTACSARDCAVPGCDRPVFFATTDWCAPHHHRHKRHGDVLADVPIASDWTGRAEVARMAHARRW